MPGIMFQDVVCPRANSNREWYTLPLSFIVHTSALAALIVVPLLATTDLLPMPRTALQFETPVVPVVPSAPPVRRTVSLGSATGAPSAPVIAPDTIGVEPGIVFQPGDVETSRVDSIVGGIDVGQITAEALPPVVAPPTGPVRTGGNIKPPTRIKYVTPEYPEMAKAVKVQGVVIIEAIIGPDGKVENAKVLRGQPLLDGAALDAVRSWEYTPTLLNGAPTSIIMTVTVQFHLN
jgi:periplasmic protein TonB